MSAVSSEWEDISRQVYGMLLSVFKGRKVRMVLIYQVEGETAIECSSNVSTEMIQSMCTSLVERVEEDPSHDRELHIRTS